MIDPVQRGSRATLLLNDDLMLEAFNTVEAAYMRELRHGKTVEERENAHKHLVVLDKVKSHLKSTVTTGNLTRKELDDLAGKKRFFG